MSGVHLVQVAVVCVISIGSQYPAEAQECATDTTSRRTAGGSVFVERWAQDEDNLFSTTCCGDLFQCSLLSASCLQCDDDRCDPLKVAQPGCQGTDCLTFGLVCDQRSDCPDSADESHCGDIVRSYSTLPEHDITATELVIHGVSLETCAAYCFFHPATCQVFSYSNSSGSDSEFFGITQRTQISLGRPLYSSRCHIGCQACGLSVEPRAGFTRYRSTPATFELRLQVQQRRAADDPALELLPPRSTCGRRQTEITDVTLVDRVAGGEASLRGEFPWQAQIQTFNSKLGRHGAWEHSCGGVIISERFVLTAAHCMTKALSDYQVVIGQYDLRVTESSELTFGIKEKQDLPDYLANRTKVGDLTVLLLNLADRPAISFSAEVRPACLIRDVDATPPPGTECLISGWGITIPGTKEAPHRLRGAKVPIVSDDFCRTIEVYGTSFIPERMVCAGYVEGGVDSCQGDSGGGLVCPTPDGSWQVVGVVATGSDKCGAAGKPGIYTELQPYYRKIIDILKALS